jgi:hypothetical protein
MTTPGPRALVIFAGPLAWFAEMSIGYVLATEPCFPTDRRLAVPAAGWAWTHTGLRQQPQSQYSAAVAGSRPRFAALWGAALGGGFLVATLLTGVGLVVLPRCGG